MTQQLPLKPNESIVFSLRSLFDSYGYSLYKMSKFEEYDLYSKNKDSLVSDGVITFTDTNGKLMALKPDVTLSIVKNTSNSKATVQKLYYNENVYRVSKSSHTFKEIMQVGLECIGEIDSFCIFEVLSLALNSLFSVFEHSVLDVSNLDILTQVIEYLQIPNSEKADVIRCIGEKNFHELSNICSQLGVSDEKIGVLKELVAIHDSPDTAFPKMNNILKNIVDSETLSQFEYIVSSLGNTDAVKIDFSVVDDIHYYNGIVFKGFIEGVPNSVLSGGQYDTLMKKMKRKEKAIGFAVYLDMLEQLNKDNVNYDVDTVIVYDDATSFQELQSIAGEYRKSGSTLLLCDVPNDLRYRKLLKVEKGEVKQFETNA